MASLSIERVVVLIVLKLAELLLERDKLSGFGNNVIHACIVPDRRGCGMLEVGAEFFFLLFIGLDSLDQRHELFLCDLLPVGVLRVP